MKYGTILIRNETRDRLKQIGRKNQTYDQLLNELIKLKETLQKLQSRLENDRLICEAAGCEEQATEEIKISAGKYGTLVLSIYSKCVRKFQD